VHRARRGLLELNSRARRRAEMDPQLRAQLIEEFAPEVRKLASLIDRDLTAWLPAGSA
jgi:hypothetical protein